MEVQKQIIEKYIQAYNAFDVAGMTAHLDREVIFENIAEGTLTLSTQGLTAFRGQAETAKSYFSKRRIMPLSWKFDGDTVRIDIAYEAILAADFPNGMKKGDALVLKGRSEFTFKEGRIIHIRDLQ